MKICRCPLGKCLKRDGGFKNEEKKLYFEKRKRGIYKRVNKMNNAFYFNNNNILGVCSFYLNKYNFRNICLCVCVCVRLRGGRFLIFRDIKFWM